MLSYKIGVVTNVNHQRMFGFVQENGTLEQAFFHFLNYAMLFDFGDAVIYRRPGFSKTLYPKKGDKIYYRSSLGSKGIKVDSWVFEVDYLLAKTLRLREMHHSQREQSDWKKPGPRKDNPSNSWTDARKTKDDYRRTPPPSAPPKIKTWREVLSISASGRVTRELINSQYRKLCLIYHPDVPGGNHEKMVELNNARTIALKLAI